MVSFYILGRLMKSQHITIIIISRDCGDMAWVWLTRLFCSNGDRCYHSYVPPNVTRHSVMIVVCNKQNPFIAHWTFWGVGSIVMMAI